MKNSYPVFEKEESKFYNTTTLQDELTGALIGLANACGNNTPTENTTRLIIEGLYTTITNTSYNDETLKEMIEQVREDKFKVVPNCKFCSAPCGNTSDYDMAKLWNADEDIRSLKSLILLGIRGMAIYAYRALILGYEDEKVNDFFYKALSFISFDLDAESLLPVVLEMGEINLKCMELLNKALHVS